MIGEILLAASLTATGGVLAEPPRPAYETPLEWAPFMECVIPRESHGNPRALNPDSGAMGLAQFTPNWQGSLQFHVSRRLKAYGVPASIRAHVRQVLAVLPINHWPEEYQRIGMVQVLVEGGWRHWSGKGCNGLVP